MPIWHLLVRERGGQMLRVLNDNGGLEGIVTKTDILRAVGTAREQRPPSSPIANPLT